MSAGESIKISTLAARLADEPYRLPLQQIGRLTPWQINHVYFHPRDREGKLLVVPAEETPYEELFRETWRRRGLPDWRISQKWRDYQKKLRDGDG